MERAVQRNIPYWGNSFGNAYFQAAQWLNNNAEQNARIALVQGTMTNIPTIQLRQDIDFSNLNWSGIFQKGEYMVELTHNDPVRLYPYGWDYIETFLTPVHEVSVDGVALAKIWTLFILIWEVKKGLLDYMQRFLLSLIVVTIFQLLNCQAI